MRYLFQGLPLILAVCIKGIARRVTEEPTRSWVRGTRPAGRSARRDPDDAQHGAQRGRRSTIVQKAS